MRRKGQMQQEYFAFFSALTITVVIFLLWLVTLIYGINMNQDNPDNLASPFGVFLEQIKGIFNGVEIYNAKI